MDIGKVTIKQSTRTVIADPKYQVKPNVALVELSDTDIVEPENGEVLVYDALTAKFKSSPLGEAQVSLVSINGGSF